HARGQGGRQGGDHAVARRLRRRPFRQCHRAICEPAKETACAARPHRAHGPRHRLLSRQGERGLTFLPASSLRRRLLLWLLVSTAVIGVIALADTYREAVKTANAVSDRVLAGSALAIAERVVVTENGMLEVDIPYVALEMLTSAAQDRVFYRVDGPPGQFITGYQTLPTSANMGG